MKVKNISLIGMGPGNSELLTVGALNALSDADIIIGAKRMIEGIRQLYSDKNYIIEYKTDEILKIIRETENCNIALLFSGDLSLFSGSQKLYLRLKDLQKDERAEYFDIKIFPGISCLSYLCGKSNIDISKVKILSFHGKSDMLYNNIVSNRYTFVITSNADGVREICKRLLSFKLPNLRITLGENLSYPDKKISVDTPENTLASDISDLNCMIIGNPDAVCVRDFGLDDDLFLRDKVPMTK